MKSLLSKTGETIDSKIRAETNPKDQANAAIDTTPEAETTGTRTGSIASTASYKITRRMNASKEFEKRNCAEIDKEEPIGLECT